MSYDDSQLYIPIFDPKVQENFSHSGTVRSKISPFCMIQPKVVFCVLAVDLGSSYTCNFCVFMYLVIFLSWCNPTCLKVFFKSIINDSDSSQDRVCSSRLVKS